MRRMDQAVGSSIVLPCALKRAVLVVTLQELAVHHRAEAESSPCQVNI